MYGGNFYGSTNYAGLGNKVSQLYSVVLTETLVFADSLARRLTLFRILTETLNFADSCGKVFRVLLTETLLFSDSILKKISKVLIENLILSDTISRRLILKRLLTESIVVTDIVSRTGKFYRLLTENILFSDTLLVAYDFIRRPYMLATVLLKPLLSALNRKPTGNSTKQLK